MVEVALHAVAHARAGDKGNRSNVCVIPYLPAAFQYLVEQVTEERVLAVFAHKGATRVTRYLLPKLPAMNFVRNGPSAALFRLWRLVCLRQRDRLKPAE